MIATVVLRCMTSRCPNEGKTRIVYLNRLQEGLLLDWSKMVVCEGCDNVPFLVERLDDQTARAKYADIVPEPPV